MPLTIPTLDDRRYQELLDSALARIPVHTPEWTNFNRSDPGVTLIEVFAFLTENLLYRANQIPERNRRKFLTLLGVPLQPAAPARGVVVFSKERGALKTVTLNRDVEARAGNVPFRTELGLDVLPIEAPVYYKRRIDSQLEQQKKQYYAELYASYLDPLDPNAQANLQLYETVPLETRGDAGGFDLSQTVDGSLWIALMVRSNDKPYPDSVAAAREAIAGKTLSLGIVPSIDETRRDLSPGQPAPSNLTLLEFYMPSVPANGELPADRVPQYKALESSSTTDVLSEPGIVQVTLPQASELALWANLDPLEAGVKNLPPALDETDKADRIITWLRVRAATGTHARLLWVGANATTVTQQARVANELLGDGTGEPDQAVTLSRTPVVPGSARLTVFPPGSQAETWEELDDLLTAGPEVPIADLRQPPGMPAAFNPRVNVFALDPEAGVIRFGDGARGRRPPFGASMRASYAYSVGRAGNVGPGSINAGPALPEGITVTNPVRTWGGADAETVAEGEKHIPRFLQHRERLVTAEDFETVARRTPGVEIGRVDVLPAYHPELSTEPGDWAGAVTLMLIPEYDARHPTAPLPDRVFLNAVCAHLDPRRLVTTELFLRGPDYQPIWVSIGVKVTAGYSVAQAREDVRQTLMDFLSPFTWPLNKPVIDRELMAVASRVSGITLVNSIQVARGNEAAKPQIDLIKLQLPHVMRISVSVGDALLIDQIRAQSDLIDGGTDGGTATGGDQGGRFVAVPVIPEECR